ncbi:MAG: hypothetical protein GOVbin1096_118 [Prokaryotic dsDNA virus sp.]|jgi:hypothetical protein|nr:MAG: hypothetical protein GOVbin1096_118 [Prokaryotic dsDNA virus sp.]|tara:strand:- start:29676 stop:29906 length:231 start_codon:yes stop_codon:yes gene_type:complete
MAQVEKIYQSVDGLTYFYINNRYIPIPTCAVDNKGGAFFIKQIEEKHHVLLESTESNTGGFFDNLTDVTNRYIMTI